MLQNSSSSLLPCHHPHISRNTNYLVQVFSNALLAVLLCLLFSSSNPLAMPVGADSELLAAGSSDSSPISRVAIIGQGRSGTTLIGSAFDTNEDVFYLFEPIKHFFNIPLAPNDLAKVIEDLYNCEIHDERIFWPYARAHMRWFQKTFGWHEDYLDFVPNATDFATVRKICLGARIRVIKVIEVPSFRLFNPANTKIIHVVRHPLRVLNSWLAFDWIYPKDVPEVAKRICSETMVFHDYIERESRKSNGAYAFTQKDISTVGKQVALPTAADVHAAKIAKLAAARFLTVFPEIGVNATTLYRFALPNEPLQAAHRWEKMVQERVDMHSGEKFSGPRDLVLQSVDVDALLQACEKVIKILPPRAARLSINKIKDTSQVAEGPTGEVQIVPAAVSKTNKTFPQGNHSLVG